MAKLQNLPLDPTAFQQIPFVSSEVKTAVTIELAAGALRFPQTQKESVDRETEERRTPQSCPPQREKTERTRWRVSCCCRGTLKRLQGDYSTHDPSFAV